MWLQSLMCEKQTWPRILHILACPGGVDEVLDHVFSADIRRQEMKKLADSKTGLKTDV